MRCASPGQRRVKQILLSFCHYPHLRICPALARRLHLAFLPCDYSTHLAVTLWMGYKVYLQQRAASTDKKDAKAKKAD